MNRREMDKKVAETTQIIKGIRVELARSTRGQIKAALLESMEVLEDTAHPMNYCGREDCSIDDPMCDAKAAELALLRIRDAVKVEEP